MMKLRLRLFLFLLILCQSTISLAGRGMFGPEWTFTSEEIIKSNQQYTGTNPEQGAIQKWIKAVRQVCRQCRIQGNKVVYDENFWFKIGTDPFVLEVTAQPMSAAKFRRYKTTIQKIVFSAAETAGLFVHERLVGGHIHLDLKTNFGRNDLLTRNFVVDLMNHPELFMGAFSHDYLNAPPVATLGAGALKKLEKIIARFDRGEIELSEMFSQIRSEVYSSSKSIMSSSKYQAINLNHDETIEIRGFQPQTSAEHHLAMIELLDARIEYLKTLDRPVPLEVENLAGKYRFKEVDNLHSYETLLEPRQIVEAYHKYVTEAGLDWNDYKDYWADARVREYMEGHGKRLKINRPTSCRRVMGG